MMSMFSDIVGCQISSGYVEGCLGLTVIKILVVLGGETNIIVRYDGGMMATVTDGILERERSTVRGGGRADDGSVFVLTCLWR